jgi:molecular chaperone Hsp33
MKVQDKLMRFIFDEAPVRGEIVRLDESYQESLKRHPYPVEVQRYLGEALVCASLLSATLKYQGALILQIQGEGNLSLLLAQANAYHEIRGLAKWEGEVSPNFDQATGKGHLLMTIDPGRGKERYQSVVALKGHRLAQMVESYFYQSEQLPTYLFFCANSVCAAGLLLQLMPGADDRGHKYWQHLYHLASTLKTEEILSLEMEAVLHRLFHQEKLNILDEHPIKFVCRCSRDAMAKSIVLLGREEARQLLEEKQVVSVTCEFCHKQQDFDRIDVERIFLASSSDDDRVLQ